MSASASESFTSAASPSCLSLENLCEDGKIICFCNEEAVLLTSRTEKNPGRRFYRCKYYKSPGIRCKFFRWFDEEILVMKMRRLCDVQKTEIEQLKKMNVELNMEICDLKADLRMMTEKGYNDEGKTCMCKLGMVLLLIFGLLVLVVVVLGVVLS